MDETGSPMLPFEAMERGNPGRPSIGAYLVPSCRHTEQKGTSAVVCSVLSAPLGEVLPWLRHTKKCATLEMESHSRVSISCNFILFNKQLNHILHLVVNEWVLYRGKTPHRTVFTRITHAQQPGPGTWELVPLPPSCVALGEELFHHSCLFPHLQNADNKRIYLFGFFMMII